MGWVMRVLFVPLFVASLVLGLAGRAAAEDDAKAVIEKAIKAHGGEEKLAKLKAGRMKTKIRLEEGGGLDLTQEAAFMLPDKIKEVVELTVDGNQVRVVSVFNGDKGWIKINGKEIKVDDKVKESLKEQGHLSQVSRLVPLRGKEFTLTSLGESKVDDKTVVGVKVARKGHQDIDLHFDKKTGLLTKVERRGTDPMSGQ